MIVVLNGLKIMKASTMIEIKLSKSVGVLWSLSRIKRTVWNKGQHTKVKFSEEEKMHVTNSVQDLTTCNE